MLEILTFIPYPHGMRALVTSKGQVTIPKKLRDKFGIEPGVQLDFIAAPDGIRVSKIVRREERSKVFGCLKKELSGRSVAKLLDDLRGPVELTRHGRKAKRT